MKPDELFLQYIRNNYKSELNSIGECKHQYRLNIDYTLLNNYFEEKAGRGFFQYPNWNKILTNAEAELNIKRNNKNWIYIKITDVPPNCTLHELDATYNGDMISAKALIKNITEPKPALKTAMYECKGCMRLTPVKAVNGVAPKPTLCPECGGRTFNLLDDSSEYLNYRLVKLEEPLEYRKGGATREFKGYMQDYLASPYHTLKAGDVVDIVGEFNIRKSDKTNKKSEFEFLINLHNINTVNNAFEDYRITEEDKQEILELSKQPNIYNRLVKSLAPEIVGFEDVKQGLLLQMFEGYRPADDVFKSEVMDRWTSHILLIGDVGIGKSQLITAIKNKAPRIIDINGADTSKAGLTTSAVKDELTGSWTLEAGALVLADTGILCIDEFDKLSKGTQKSLNQCMEQLTVSSAKAGLVQTMSARTSIVAIANPKYSRWTDYKDLREQINIPDSTLSRFDLVFKLTDKVDVDKDTELATALLNKDSLLDDVDLIPTELFKKYVTYAKLEIFPRLTDEAKKVLIDFYVRTRQSAIIDQSAKPITARDLKALERLTIMRSKTELRENATVEDAKCAINLYCSALKTIGLTPETAGEKESVLSDVEIQAVNDIEKMITAKMEQYNIGNVNQVILSDIKHEAGLLCHSLKLSLKADELVKIAVNNIKRG